MFMTNMSATDGGVKSKLSCWWRRSAVAPALIAPCKPTSGGPEDTFRLGFGTTRNPWAFARHHNGQRYNVCGNEGGMCLPGPRRRRLHGQSVQAHPRNGATSTGQLRIDARVGWDMFVMNMSLPLNTALALKSEGALLPVPL